MRRQKAAPGAGLIALALLGLVAGPVDGEATPLTQEAPELLTDRPDFTETSVVVPRGSLQLETGFTATDGADGGRILNAPELLLRYGLGPRTELRLGLPDYLLARGHERFGQFGDTYLGVKQQLRPSGARTALALIPAVVLPTGGKRVTSHRVDPEFVLAWSQELSAVWSVGGILGLAWPTEQSKRNRTFSPTISFGRTLSSRWETFFEWAAEFPDRGGNVHLFHHGYTYSVTRASQADLHFGFGLSRAAPNFFIGGGFAVRH
jgi:hypothetical protein